jgi:hypothetical protein
MKAMDKEIEIASSASLGGFRDKDKKKNYKPPENITESIDAFRELKRALSEVDIALAENRAKQDLTTSDKEKLKLQKEEIELIREKKVAIEDLGKLYGEKGGELRNSLRLRGIKFDDGNLNEGSYKAEIKRREAVINAMTKKSQQDDRKAKKKDLEDLKKDAQNAIDWREELLSTPTAILINNKEEIE